MGSTSLITCKLAFERVWPILLTLFTSRSGCYKVFMDSKILVNSRSFFKMDSDHPLSTTVRGQGGGQRTVQTTIPGETGRPGLSWGERVVKGREASRLNEILDRLVKNQLQYLLRSGRRWREGKRGGRQTAASRESRGPAPATGEPGLGRAPPPRRNHCVYRAERETRPAPAGAARPF